MNRHDLKPTIHLAHSSHTGNLYLFLFALFLFMFPCSPAELFSKTFEAEEALQLNPDRTVVISRDSFAKSKGVMLKPGLVLPSETRGVPDLTFEVVVPKAATYRIGMFAGLDTQEGERILSKATTKFDSLFTRIQINNNPWRTYVLFAPWYNPNGRKSDFGLHELPQGKSIIQVFLPEKVQVDYLELLPWKPVAVPDKAASWVPPIIPPKGHPRLWVRSDTLAQVKSNLETEENLFVWKNVKKAAVSEMRKLHSCHIDNREAISSIHRYLQQLEQKAFYYLVTNDKRIGREAVETTLYLLEHVQFGNILDITRERGLSIYTTSLVYDWCYSLLAENEKRFIEKQLLLSAREMEISWPPFRQYIVNGHGNEAQLLRDLLCMSIAIYDADPEPYRLCAYRIFEELIPLRAFEYQSSRHNQGISYASARVVWDLTAAALLEQMSGKRVFDDNICNVADYFLQMRLPNGEMFNDGDRWGTGVFRYSHPALMMYSYGKNPVMKAEYFRQNGGKPEYASVLFLLLNDPKLKSDPSFKSIPTGFDAGPIFPAQILRTGWMKDDWFTKPLKSDPDNDEVIVELRGGNFNSGNHQHADAGAFQIWYRGKQTCDLGVYCFYGTKYDVNFNKGSSSHNLVFVYDPDEKFADQLVNDAGQRHVRSTPLSSKDYLEKPLFQTSKLLKSQIEPSPFAPLRSEFTLDLAPAYSDKVQAYIRSFRWLNLKRKDVPVVLIVYDKITTRTSKPAGKLDNFWQINTLNKPEMNDNGFISSAPIPEGATVKPGRMALTILLPAKDDRDVKVYGGEQSNNIFEHHMPVPPRNLPELHGWRIQYSNKIPRETTVYLNVIQLLGDSAAQLPVSLKHEKGKYIVTIDGKTETFDD